MIRLFRATAFLLALLMSFSLAAQEGNANNGKTLFRNYCASCHNKNMVSDMTGPALAGAEERWADYDRTVLYSWIRNSQAMISEGNIDRANQLWADWGSVMTAFPNLTDQDIEDMLAYINGVADGSFGAPKTTGTDDVAAAPEKRNNTPLFIVLAVVLGILALVLARILSNLSFMLKTREGNAPAQRRTLMDILTSRSVIGFALFALILLGGSTIVNNAIEMGRQQDYAPEQPIKFSHVTHAGIQKIDCQYCHDGARRSKHSVIPAANTCMNCHTAVKVGSKYGTAELTKIYASTGWNPNTDTYIEDYENMPRTEIKEIYTKWMKDAYVEEKGKLDMVGEELVEEQWQDLVDALTSKEFDDDKIYGPIPWVRIHNLPDHVYFNHAQHVAVGQLECQACHGPVEEMEVVSQYTPLSMGWCVNCHRQTEVDFNNDYYKDYARYHEEIANGDRSKVTVEEIGGLECQKCHY